jgi:ribose transport system permease protein
MGKILRILVLLIIVASITIYNNENFLQAGNIKNVLQRASLWGIIGIGAAFVIITGGIDLSIGAVVGIIGTLFFYFITIKGIAVPLALFYVLGIAVSIGLIHGLLITKLKIQPFVVTLCSMMIYRGVSRWIANDRTISLGKDHAWLRDYSEKFFELPGGYLLPITLVYLLILAVISWILLNRTIFGRYILAIGRNEQATRYCGIKTSYYVIMTYVICSVLSGVAGILFAFYSGSVQPSNHGNSNELYAIAAAVLGGCSLRGGEGTIIGVVLGAALIPLIGNMINLLGIQTSLELTVIGAVILAGAIVDQTFHFWSGYFKTRKIS